MTPIQIAQRLPRNVGAKLFLHFRHPNAILIQNYWKEPVILKKNWVIAQLNRYNWLTHSGHLHNYGGGIMHLPYVRKRIHGENSPLAWKLKLHKKLDPCTLTSNHPMVVAFGDVNIVILKRAKVKLWKCKKKGIKYDDHNEWKMRSLFGGVYPIHCRPKARVPRNPWTGRWNTRWRKGGDLRKLIAKKWDRQPWRMCQWGGAGTVVKKLDGTIYIYMGPMNVEFIPYRSWDIDPYL